jgi:1-acyl-sn-glycerol-3-phosphate acyltransferase
VIQPDSDRTSTAYRAAALAVGSLYRLGDLAPYIAKLSASGLENIPLKDAYLLAYTHHNSWDIPAIGTVVYQNSRRPVHFLAKQELLADSYRWGQLLKAMHALPVKRGQTTSEQIRNAVGVLEQGHVLGIAAEGGRVDGDRVAEVQGGAGLIATKANIEVLPVGVAGRNWRMRNRDLPFLPRSIHIHFGESIAPDGSSRHHREELDRQLPISLKEALDEAYMQYGAIHGQKAAAKLDTGLTKLF